MTYTDPAVKYLVPAIRMTKGTGLGKMDIVIGTIDTMVAAHEFTVDEIDGWYTDLEATYERLMSNGSPCWECGKNTGEILWDDARAEYRHETCM